MSTVYVVYPLFGSTANGTDFDSLAPVDDVVVK
jgi:hypothetical protein